MQMSETISPSATENPSKLSEIIVKNSDTSMSLIREVCWCVYSLFLIRYIRNVHKE